jgi:large subunit ribosomal protein L28
MICEICGKRRMVGHKVSHSNIKTKKRQYGNVQKIHASVNGGVKRMQVCTRCLRSGKVVKAA